MTKVFHVGLEGDDKFWKAWGQAPGDSSQQPRLVGFAYPGGTSRERDILCARIGAGVFEVGLRVPTVAGKDPSKLVFKAWDGTHPNEDWAEFAILDVRQRVPGLPDAQGLIQAVEKKLREDPQAEGRRRLTPDEEAQLKRLAGLVVSALGVRTTVQVLIDRRVLPQSTGHQRTLAAYRDLERVVGALARAFVDVKTRHRTATAVGDLTVRALKSAPLDHRASHAFERARACLQQGREAQWRALLRRLRELRDGEVDPHPLLAEFYRALLLTAGSPIRVIEALQAEQPELETLDAEETAQPAANPEPTEAATLPPPSDPMPSVALEIPAAEPAETPPAPAPSLPLEGASNATSGDWETALADARHGLLELVKAQAQQFDVNELRKELGVALSALSDGDPEDAAWYVGALADLSRRLGELAAGAKQSLEALEAVRAEAQLQIGRHTLGADPEEVVREMDALREHLGQLPAEVAANAAQLLQTWREAGLWTALKSARTQIDRNLDEAKQQEIRELQARLQKLLGGSAPPAPHDIPSPDGAVVVAPPEPPVLAGTFPPSAKLSSFPPASATLRSLWQDLLRRPPADVFLPVPSELVGPAGTRDRPDVQATAAAAMVLAVARLHVAQGQGSPHVACDLFQEAAIFGNTSEAENLFRNMLFGLVLTSASPARRSRKVSRVVDRLVLATDGPTVQGVLVELASVVADEAGLAVVLAKAVESGFDATILDLIEGLGARSALKQRQWLEAVATALAASSPDRSEAFLRECQNRAGVEDDDLDRMAEYLDAAARRPRKVLTPPPLGATWAAPLVQALASRIYESSTTGTQVCNASVPQQVHRHGLQYDTQAGQVQVPILIRSSGTRGVAGLEVVVQEVGSKATREAQVAWLSCEGLVGVGPDALIEVPITPGDPAAAELMLTCNIRWLGGSGRSPKLRYALSKESGAVALLRPAVAGVNGDPMPLDRPEVLNRSSNSVRTTYLRLRDRLHTGEPVRELVYGRRRRGKSSIRATLQRDEAIKAHYAVKSIIWNSAPIANLRAAMEALAGLIRSACLQRVSSVPEFALDVDSREQLFQTWQRWLDEVASALPAPVHVLLLIDEFQRWLTGLSEARDRQTVLNAFRHFNDTAAGSKLAVSFVLFGLRSLKRYASGTESNDFANAVQMSEIKHLDGDESRKYVRESLPLEHDERVRDRLARMSGGNPFVLNLLCGELVNRLTAARRVYCLVSDVQALVDDMDGLDSRINSFFRYMLRQDEDEGAPSLPQLTVLRSIASLQHQHADFEAAFGSPEVEEWLTKQQVEFETDVVQEQLKELVDAGMLETVGGRYNLQGEAMCCWLAALGAEDTPILPVVRRANPDLVLNRYHVQRVIAQGGQAKVYEAKDVEIGGSVVALKIYDSSSIDAPQRARREAALLRRVHDSRVVNCLEAGRDPTKGEVVVLEWLPGHTLLELLEKQPVSARGILPGGDLEEQVALMQKTCQGVAAIHHAGIVHKDLSSRNLMLAEHGGVWEPRIFDFGLAGEASVDSHVVETVSAVTHRYVAPEKIRGEPRGPRADVYSLGVVFVDILAPASPGSRPLDQLAVATELVGRAPKLVALVKEMLGEDPSSRPDTESVAIRLGSVLDSETWQDNHSAANDAYLSGDFETALSCYRRAIAEVPRSDLMGKVGLQLIKDTLECTCEVPDKVDFWDTLIRTSLEVGRYAEVDFWGHLLKPLGTSAKNRTGRRENFALLVRCLRDVAPTPGMAPLVAELCAEDGVAGCAEEFQALAVQYVTGDLLTGSRLAEFCVSRARAARESGQPLTVGELWLRRGRRLAPANPSLKAEYGEFDAALTRTRVTQVLPDDAAVWEDHAIGDGERGHLNVDRILNFAEKVRDAFTFVMGVRRVRKDPKLRNTRPVVLGLDNIGQHRIQGLEQERIIPIVLDASYTRGTSQQSAIPLRMNLILPPGTTASQQEAAHARIRENKSLFSQDEME